ncbi:MAG TPA: type II toxin-antitoxin system HipA family toxin [Bacteroidales bacterium]|nr:type II toxin-antitoxin system HipA family toxin [Bacteroidales bacterium]
METALKITLWGKDVAAIVWDEAREYAILEFFESFGNTGFDIAPLLMPIADIKRGDRIFSFPAHRGKTFKGLPGLVADSLPDDYGNSVIDEWFASKNMDVVITPLDRLKYMGKRGMGALEYEPAESIAGLNESAIIEMDELTALAQKVLNQREQFSSHLKKTNKSIIDILRVGTSAGGAKPKAIIALNDKTHEVRSGQVKAPRGFSYWLLKFDGLEGGKIKDNPLGIGRIEYAYYKMATACGIDMTESRLMYEGDYAHFMTKRFDRTDAGEKLHTQTLCAIAHFDRDERFSYEQIFQTMRRLYLPHTAMEQMFRRMVFNVAARNHDDHTKNHSFIMDTSGQWSLAPAYDLCYAYSPSGQWTNRHQLSLNGKRDHFTLKDLLAVAEKADVVRANEIIQQITETVSQWRDYARKADVKPEYATQIEKSLRLNLK